MTRSEELPNIPNRLPLLPLKGTVIFPHQVQGLGVGRQKSLGALEAAVGESRLIALAAQRDDDVNDPKPKDIHTVGTVCRILQVGKQPDGVLQVIVEGLVRANLTDFVQDDPHFVVEVEPRPDLIDKSVELEALMRGLISQFERFARLSRSIPPDQVLTVTQAEEPGRLADLVIQHLTLKLDERQQLLEAEVKARLERVSGILTR